MERKVIAQERKKFYKYALIGSWIFITVGGALLLGGIGATRKHVYLSIFLFS